MDYTHADTQLTVFYFGILLYGLLTFSGFGYFGETGGYFCFSLYRPHCSLFNKFLKVQNNVLSLTNFSLIYMKHIDE